MIYQPAEDSFLLEREVRKRAKGKKVLELGCGSGILMEGALKGGASSVLGVDIDEKSLEFCKRIISSGKIPKKYK